MLRIQYHMYDSFIQPIRTLRSKTIRHYPETQSFRSLTRDEITGRSILKGDQEERVVHRLAGNAAAVPHLLRERESPCVRWCHVLTSQQTRWSTFIAKNDLYLKIMYVLWWPEAGTNFTFIICRQQYKLTEGKNPEWVNDTTMTPDCVIT